MNTSAQDRSTQDRSTQSNSRPFLHTTPKAAIGQLVTRSVTLSDPRTHTPSQRVFKIARPSNTDQLLDHPSTHSAYEADQYIPYWAEVWPASCMLGSALLAEAAQPSWPPNGTALEIGCGVGLCGVAALSLGLRVIFSDYDETAVAIAAQNAAANGFTNFETLPLDWRVPPDFQVPLLLAADVIYEERNIAPLVSFIQKVLTADGICLLSDPDRSTRGGFCFALKQAQLAFSRQPMETPGPNERMVKGTVYRITKKYSRKP